MSMHDDDMILFDFITFIAAFYPVILFIASETEPNPPSPNNFII